MNLSYYLLWNVSVTYLSTIAMRTSCPGFSSFNSSVLLTLKIIFKLHPQRWRIIAGGSPRCSDQRQEWHKVVRDDVPQLCMENISAVLLGLRRVLKYVFIRCVPDDGEDISAANNRAGISLFVEFILPVELISQLGCLCNSSWVKLAKHSFIAHITLTLGSRKFEPASKYPQVTS